MNDSNTTTAVVKAPEKPSWVQNFVDRAKGTIERAEPKSAVSYVREAGSTAGDYALGGAVGGVLGAAHAKFGLDTRGGPIDGWISGLGAIFAVGLSGYFPNAAAYARKVGSGAFTILAFRKTYGGVSKHPLPSGGVTRVAAPAASSTVAGEDPIDRVARGL